MADNTYASIDILYENAKEEYIYQRERLEKIEAKVELIITLVSAVFTFEVANALKVLNIRHSIDSVEDFLNFLMAMWGNIPYLISLVLLVIAIVKLIFIVLNIKCRVVDIVKLYNKKVYTKTRDEVIPYLTAVYIKCNAYNFEKINSLYKKISRVVIIAIISILSFGLAYIF